MSGATVHSVDRELVEILVLDGKHRLTDTWENGVYAVVDMPNAEIPAYTVKIGNGVDRRRILHKNWLIPSGYVADRQNSFEESGDL